MCRILFSAIVLLIAISLHPCFFSFLFSFVPFVIKSILSLFFLPFPYLFSIFLSSFRSQDPFSKTMTSSPLFSIISSHKSMSVCHEPMEIVVEKHDETSNSALSKACRQVFSTKHLDMGDLNHEEV